jgi:hypothetical protein
MSAQCRWAHIMDKMSRAKHPAVVSYHKDDESSVRFRCQTQDPEQDLSHRRQLLQGVELPVTHLIPMRRSEHFRLPLQFYQIISRMEIPRQQTASVES